MTNVLLVAHAVVGATPLGYVYIFMTEAVDSAASIAKGQDLQHAEIARFIDGARPR